jgi:hypothetical protein
MYNILHITNHPGTTQNLKTLTKYLNIPETNLVTERWAHGLYVTKEQANTLWNSIYKNKVLELKYNILFFTDIPLYARPFLQNIEDHNCIVIIYIANRFDWGTWNYNDSSYFELYSEISKHPRVFFTAENRYDQYYTKLKNVTFYYDDIIRLTPVLSDTVNLPITSKFFILHRGMQLANYKLYLDQQNISYEMFGEGYTRFRDQKHITEYIGIFHLPYQTNIQSLSENWGYNIIYFIPSKRFITDLIFNSTWYYWEEKTKSKELVINSIEYSEWYQPENEQFFEYFDSWEELGTKYKFLSNNIKYDSFPIEYLEKKITLVKQMKIRNRQNINLWKTIFEKATPINENELNEINKNNMINKVNEESNSVFTDVTIVTMFYNIRKLDCDETNYHRKLDTFKDLANKFILQLPYPLIIFIDKNDLDMKKFIETSRLKTNKGINSNTLICYISFEDTYFYKYVNRIKELQNIHKIANGNPRHETPLYITLNNNKFYFMEKAIEINPFSSNKFMWMDMGINHVAKEPNMIHNWIRSVPDKIKQLCINPYLENDIVKDYFILIRHNCAGGLFSGNKDNILKYIQLYKNKVEQIYNENWYQIDEAIMTIVQRENPDLFEFYYGDYEGIIANYLEPKYSIGLIIQGSEKAIRYNKSNFAYKILRYLSPYFKIKERRNNDWIYRYISQNIICNYYNNNSLLHDDVIEYINEKLSADDKHMMCILRCNQSNLNFYKNKNNILDF